MSRVSQAQARENRQRVVETATRLFRERGVSQVSVADVMAGAGLTHGGFYKQFASKDALAVEALAQGLAEVERRLSALGEPGARAGFLDHYLSPDHRDDPGDGCPIAGFARDMPAADPDLAATFGAGVEYYADQLGDLAAVSTAVGALILARATAGTALSDRILAEALASLRPPTPEIGS
ncbi:TetR/AcrR family transcriptional regulator, transcriptional repressor for nem operon [Asanoa hainanensis]|uniref:TetR/AcrR family transcriptional regulator, transcriptional repressor for nem operon n=1 Tax=Asanoa hainanensis TaxID=560556 RepID=A0A239PA59_9ACTN|nr:TetR family transcriptional regulator [Asanoa hainanensis]SNT63584.1 TetR/AcrR family transcriptional regulator, transcriptional repressor for nem operon [Asanoa hainanensis]